jgi:acetyltransferase-like isoleucine patch superfamily enzyme
MKKNSFLSEAEVSDLGLKQVGQNVSISRLASFYGTENITIGNNVRIDDFCILSGRITIGNYIHVAAGCYLYGGEQGIELEDFVNLSSRIVIYSKSDDYSGTTLTNPTIPEKYKQVDEAKVILQRHVLLGTGCVVLPGVVIEEGTSVGALSLINKSLPGWKICVGIPAKPIKNRKKDLLKLEEELLKELQHP